MAQKTAKYTRKSAILSATRQNISGVAQIPRAKTDKKKASAYTEAILTKNNSTIASGS